MDRAFKFVAQSTPGPVCLRGHTTAIDVSADGKTAMYCGNKVGVVMRGLHTPVCETFSGHQDDTTVARFTKDGNFVVSGDKAGNLKYWWRVNGKIKTEMKGLGGHIVDMALGPVQCPMT